MCRIVCPGYAGRSGDIRKKQERISGEEFGIEEIPSKAAFDRVLRAVSGKETGDAVLDILRMRFGTSGEVIAVGGKTICSASDPGAPHRALQTLSAYMTDNGVVLAQVFTGLVPLFSVL